MKSDTRPLFYQYIIPRYLPQNPAEPKEICRSFNKLVLLVDDNVFLCYLSVRKAQIFLSKMRSPSGSKCYCLPDCQMTDYQKDLSTTNFM